MINYKRFAAIPIMVALASCAGNVDKEALIDNTTLEGQVAQVQQTNSIIPEWFVEQEEKEGSIFSTGTGEIGRAHVRTPVTRGSRMPSSA